MHRRCVAALLLALMAPCAVAATNAADALGVIDACIGRLDGDTDIGFERIALRCPELERVVGASEWGAWLPAGWQDDYNNLSARSLGALRMALVRELALRPRTHTPQTALLRPILADLAARHPEDRGWWGRVRSALRGLFAPAAEHSAGWYDGLAGRYTPPQALLQAVAYTTLVFCVILAGFIVVSEWRAAARPERRARAAGIDAAAQGRPPLRWHDVECAAPEARARLLLELVLARLTAAQRLPAADALTVRELTRAAQLPDLADRERLQEIAFAAERMRFSLEPPTSAAVARFLVCGRELLERLGEPLAQSGGRL